MAGSTTADRLSLTISGAFRYFDFNVSVLIAYAFSFTALVEPCTFLHPVSVFFFGACAAKRRH